MNALYNRTTLRRLFAGMQIDILAEEVPYIKDKFISYDQDTEN